MLPHWADRSTSGKRKWLQQSFLFCGWPNKSGSRKQTVSFWLLLKTDLSVTWIIHNFLLFKRKNLQNWAATKFAPIQKLRFIACKTAAKLQFLRQMLRFNWFKNRLWQYLWSSTEFVMYNGKKENSKIVRLNIELLIRFCNNPKLAGNGVPHARQWIC